MLKKKSNLWKWQEETRFGLKRCSCGNPANSVDHIIPIELLKKLLLIDQALNDEENFQPLCRVCNQIKANNLDFKNPLTIPLLKKYVQMAEEQTLHFINEPKTTTRD